MKWVKLFEEFSDSEKIEKGNIIFLIFLIKSAMTKLNVQKIVGTEPRVLGEKPHTRSVVREYWYYNPTLSSRLKSIVLRQGLRPLAWMMDKDKLLFRVDRSHGADMFGDQAVISEDFLNYAIVTNLSSSYPVFLHLFRGAEKNIILIKKAFKICLNVQEVNFLWNKSVFPIISFYSDFNKFLKKERGKNDS